ncbi:MAG: JAB domain-containing protein, partial [Daejeonella sp.]|uniref:JAB domain-containing protein n=1 Tax=Daejeonella sp. TaxID=2805397 RepID=UPI003C73C745
YNILLQNWDMNKIDLLEQFKILLLNRANKVLGIYEVSSGGMTGTVADPKLIFSTALKGCANSIILSHNHPSGNLKPSQADINLTQKLRTAGSFLDIDVLDHIILTSEGYISFVEEGLM